MGQPKILELMEVVDSEGVHVGRVAVVEGATIRLQRGGVDDKEHHVTRGGSRGSGRPSGWTAPASRCCAGGRTSRRGPAAGDLRAGLAGPFRFLPAWALLAAFTLLQRLERGHQPVHAAGLAGDCLHRFRGVEQLANAASPPPR